MTQNLADATGFALSAEGDRLTWGRWTIYCTMRGEVMLNNGEQSVKMGEFKDGAATLAARIDRHMTPVF